MDLDPNKSLFPLARVPFLWQEGGLWVSQGGLQAQGPNMQQGGEEGGRAQLSEGLRCTGPLG